MKRFKATITWSITTEYEYEARDTDEAALCLADYDEFDLREAFNEAVSRFSSDCEHYIDEIREMPYSAKDAGDTWIVVDSDGGLLFDGEGAPLSRTEAMDLAWAYNHEADDYEHALKMIVDERYHRTCPPWMEADYFANMGYKQ